MKEEESGIHYDSRLERLAKALYTCRSYIYSLMGDGNVAEVGLVCAVCSGIDECGCLPESDLCTRNIITAGATLVGWGLRVRLCVCVWRMCVSEHRE